MSKVEKEAVSPKSKPSLVLNRRSFLIGGAAFFASEIASRAESKIFLPAVFKREHLLPPIKYLPDLTNDMVAMEMLPFWFRERMARPERTGELTREDYAGTTTLVEVKNFGLHKDEENQEAIGYLENGVNQWYSANLKQRQLRFEGRIQKIEINENELRREGLPLPIDDLVSVVLDKTQGIESIGLPQRVNVIFVKGVRGITRVAGNTVIMSLPENPNDCKSEKQKGIFAHLLGHALGLAHPQEDIDTVDTELSVTNSHMDPSILSRGLRDSIILDSQLNPHKARLMATGYFPYRGIIYTREDGAIPLGPSLTADFESCIRGREVKIAHGLYVIPCQGKEAVLRIRTCGPAKIDFGSAIIRQERNYIFKEQDEHITKGIALKLEGQPEARLAGIEVKGGIFISFWRTIEAEYVQGLNIEGTTVVDGRRIEYDATRPGGDKERGRWLYIWNTPKEEDGSPVDSYFSFGAGICLKHCKDSTIRGMMVAHTTQAIADFFGESNCYENNDLSECGWGIRLWQTKGTTDRPILIKRNLFDYNTQPDPWWWMMGDGAAIVGLGVEEINIEENKFRFCGDGVLLCGVPHLPGRVESVNIRGNEALHNYAHGLELDFCQDCKVVGNRISGNWLSGIWAGHSSGVLVYRNLFEGNNKGRLFSGWVLTQGAISCPEGKMVIVGNRFIDNCVGTNLFEDFQLFLWPISGDSEGHIITGNTYINNQIAIRLAGIKDSRVTVNNLIRNSEDIVQDSNCRGNVDENNGPLINSEDFPETVCFSHHRVFLTNLNEVVKIPTYLVSQSGINKIVPDYHLILGNPAENWASLRVENDTLHFIPNSDLSPGLRTAVLELRKNSQNIRIPLKMMVGKPTVLVSPLPYQEEKASNLGQTVLPNARIGFSVPISSILETPRESNITGNDRFALRFRNDRFLISPEARNILWVADFTDQISLWLSSTDPVFSLGPVGIEEGKNGIFQAEAGDRHFEFEYNRVVEYSKDTEFFPLTNLWLVPLSEDEVRQLTTLLAAGRTYPSLQDRQEKQFGWLFDRRKTSLF